MTIWLEVLDGHVRAVWACCPLGLGLTTNTYPHGLTSISLSRCQVEIPWNNCCPAGCCYTLVRCTIYIYMSDRTGTTLWTNPNPTTLNSLTSLRIYSYKEYHGTAPVENSIFQRDSVHLLVHTNELQTLVSKRSGCSFDCGFFNNLDIFETRTRDPNLKSMIFSPGCLNQNKRFY